MTGMRKPEPEPSSEPDTEPEEEPELPPVYFVTPEEGREIFDHQATELLGMSGEEFLRRWDAGEFVDVFEGPDHLKLVDMYLMLPLVRRDPE